METERRIGAYQNKRRKQKILTVKEKQSLTEIHKRGGGVRKKKKIKKK